MILNLLGFLDFSFTDILDIVVVGIIIYFIFRWLRQSSAINIFFAILLILVIKVLASVIGMKMLSGLLGTLIDVGGIAIVIIFQPEIRKFLMRMGSGAGMGRDGKSIMDRILKRPDNGMENRHVNAITEACFRMSESKTGALIVLRHNDRLQDIADTGDQIDANIRARLLENIFFKNSPLHDGAVIIGGGRIIAARCTLPITQRLDIPANYGMRHKAAIGISEISDAEVIVVSEQTGRISFVKDGTITPINEKNALKLAIGNNPAKE